MQKYKSFFIIVFSLLVFANGLFAKTNNKTHLKTETEVEQVPEWVIAAYTADSRTVKKN